MSFRITAAGSSFSDSEDLSVQDVINAEVQPGDLNLVGRKEIFRGRLQSTFSPQNGEVFFFTVFGPTNLEKESDLTIITVYFVGILFHSGKMQLKV